MKTYKIKTWESKAVHEWMMKEYGSWEDHGEDPKHPCAKLQEFGGTLELTQEEIDWLIKSGEYQSTAYTDRDMNPSIKRTISRWVKRLEEAKRNN